MGSAIVESLEITKNLELLLNIVKNLKENEIKSAADLLNASNLNYVGFVRAKCLVENMMLLSRMDLLEILL